MPRIRLLTTVLALIAGPPLWACINDSLLDQAETEFRSSYDTSPAVTSSLGEPSGIAPEALLSICVLLLLASLAAGALARLQRRAVYSVLALGLCVGMIVGAAPDAAPDGLVAADESRRAYTVNAPHTLPRIEGATGLRMAMVHDVVHQRYPHHGQAWYSERVRRDRERLAQFPTDPALAPSIEQLQVMDDLVAGLDRIHRSDEAVAIAERQLSLLQAHYPNPLDTPPDPTATLAAALMVEEAVALEAIDDAWYRCHANLGTVLVHANMRKAIAGDASARAGVERGWQHVISSLAIKPHAHFGREAWQAIAIRFILAAIDEPELLTSYTLTGRRLGDLEPDPKELVDFQGPTTRYGASMMKGGVLQTLGQAVTPDLVTQAGLDPEFLSLIGFDREQASELAWTTGFDQPTLGVVGMWIYGGGPNPHFAMALGQLMERVGQRRIAWACYARAQAMQERWWPDATIRSALVSHAQERQQAIAAAIAEDIVKDIAEGRPGENAAGSSADLPGTSAEEIHHSLQAAYEQELALGTAWQAARHAYEAEQIAAGHALDDPHFFDAFQAEHGSIVSPVGRADQVTALRGRDLDIDTIWRLSLASASAALTIMLALAGIGIRRRISPEPPAVTDR